jgi:hypothetical protein
VNLRMKTVQRDYRWAARARIQQLCCKGASDEASSAGH